MYDPTTGRFTSPDHLLNVGDPQHINGYAYADSMQSTLVVNQRQQPSITSRTTSVAPAVSSSTTAARRGVNADANLTTRQLPPDGRRPGIRQPGWIFRQGTVIGSGRNGQRVGRADMHIKSAGQRGDSPMGVDAAAGQYMRRRLPMAGAVQHGGEHRPVESGQPQGGRFCIDAPA
jgi:hypothetical protein